MELTLEEWWNSLTDEAKFKAYNGMKEANKSHADALHEIVDYLLGKDYYCLSMDTYGCNKEIVESIKYLYSDVNKNWKHTWERIKSALNDYFHK